MTAQGKTMPPQPSDPSEQGPGAALLVYILLLAAPLFMVTGIIAVVVAYIYRDEAPFWLQSHYQLQIRTFWISLLYVALGMLTWWLLLGQLVLLFWLVWYLVRCIRGIRFLNLRRPYPYPQSWWI
ncbi:MAG TPA: hypothetical protein VIQ22_08715 [Gammaproteobacteria bacterium]